MALNGMNGSSFRLLSWRPQTAAAPSVPAAPLIVPPQPAPAALPAARPAPLGLGTFSRVRQELARLMAPAPVKPPAEAPKAEPAPAPTPKPAARPEAAVKPKPKAEAKPKPKAPAKPKPKPKPKPTPQDVAKKLFARRDNWFISQYRSAKYNSREDVPGIDNANCGPTSLTMVATAFGKINPSAREADAAIEKSRRLMGDGLNQRNGTSAEGIARGARAYGLDAKIVNNIGLNDIKRELAKGRLPIINGNYIRANLSLGGGHFYVVTKIVGDKAYLNDPAIPGGPRVVSTSLLMKSVRSHWSHRLVSIGPKG